MTTKLALRDLPVELFLEITSHLQTADKQCLRITCSGFRKLIPFDWGLPLQKLSSLNDEMYFLPRDLEERKLVNQRFVFLTRCFKTQSLPSSPSSPSKAPPTEPKIKIAGCATCLRVRDMDKFAITDLEINGRLVCNDCLVTYLKTNMPRGCSIKYGGEGVYSCKTCRMRGEKEDMHLGHEYRDRGSKPRLCAQCHANICRDIECEGWPEGFVEKNKEHFEVGSAR